MKSQFVFASIVLALCVAMIGCRSPRRHTLPPAQMLMEPGPGVGGPGPGVLLPEIPPIMPGPGFGATSQMAFIGPEGMLIRWETGTGYFDSEPLVAPGRYNFPQGGIYRLKLTNIPGREGVELYPTIEVAPATPRTEAYLAHNPIPVQFTEEDLDQVQTGNFVTKVIYLPDPEFQELAQAGVETLVSTRLDPGVDPIVEADRRGSILSIIRIGSKDVELPGGGGDGAGGGVMQASYGAPCGPGGGAIAGGYMSLPNSNVAGVTTPAYGMPISGTPIGLPGPPHVPLGVPAGLQKHVIRNHTKVHLPQPTRKIAIDVKQHPGMSYPKPASHMFLWEWAKQPWTKFHQPFTGKHQLVGGDQLHGPVDCP